MGQIETVKSRPTYGLCKNITVAARSEKKGREEFDQ
jgi:hypothetical protein